MLFTSFPRPQRERTQRPRELSPDCAHFLCGKLFTSLLKNRWLRFMTSNGYLDTSVQKAFIPGVPGCLEQYEKLSAMIKDAHTKHKSLTVCWLDLANAFGSVHHQLIDFCLHHYHAPVPFISTHRSLYSNLSATVSTGSWSTRSIPLQIRVYQGDPLSVAIFNTVMVTLTDALKANKQLGYRLAAKTTSNVLQYADDTCIVANGPANCQAMLDKVQGWLQWTGMVAKVPKCTSLGILAFRQAVGPKTPSQWGTHLFHRDRVHPFSGRLSPSPYGLLTAQSTSGRKASQPPSEGGQFHGHQQAETTPLSCWGMSSSHVDLSILDLPITWVNTHTGVNGH